jgi:hypothetical protein
MGPEVGVSTAVLVNGTRRQCVERICDEQDNKMLITVPQYRVPQCADEALHALVTDTANSASGWICQLS